MSGKDGCPTAIGGGLHELVRLRCCYRCSNSGRKYLLSDFNNVKHSYRSKKSTRRRSGRIKVNFFNSRSSFVVRSFVRRSFVRSFGVQRRTTSNFERPFTPRTWLRLASNFVKTRFRRFATFDFSTQKVFFDENFRCQKDVFPQFRSILEELDDF